MAPETVLDQRLRAAHRQRIAAQLPLLAWVVTGGSILWFALATVADAGALAQVTSGGLLGILAFQLVAFAGAIALCRRDPTGPFVTACAVTACLGIGLVWVWLLTTTATMAAMLMLATMTLFSAAPLVLAWRLGPQLVYQGGLTLVWIGVLSLLPRHLPLSEIASAVAFGNVIALGATQWATSAFRREVLARIVALESDRRLAESQDAYRALGENAVDLLWAIDLEGRWTYVNETLAKRCGRRVAEMIGGRVGDVLTDHPGNPDPAALIAQLVAGEAVAPQPMEMRTVDGPRWVEAIAAPVLGAGGAVIGIRGSSRDVTERRVAEEALRSSEERFRGVFDNAPMGMTVVAPDGEILEVNRSLATMLGYAERELVGRRVHELMHPDDQPPVQGLVDAALEGHHDTLAFECRHLHRDGRPILSHVHSYLERDRDGRLRRFISQVTDVTEPRAAEAALRASERRFRSFTESMVAGVLIAAPAGIVYVNDAVSTITGFSREELLRMQVWDLVHPDEREVARTRVHARLDGRRISPRAEYRLATKSGEPRWIDLTVAMLDLEGTIVMLGTAFDVTERKVAEEALRASEARYRGLVELQRELVARFDAEGTMTFANDVYCETYGLSREQIVGHPFWPIVHPDDVEAAKEGMAAAMRPPYRSESELRSRTVSGWRWIEWEGGAIRDADGNVVEIQAAGRDVTERHRAQEALRASLEELRRSEDKFRHLAERHVAVREEERKRLSFNLHDDVCQELVGIMILVDTVAGRLGTGAPPDATADLGRATSYLREVVDHLRVMARDLRPIVLQDLGLEGSLRSLASGLSSPSTRVEAVFPRPIPRLDEWRELTVYRIAQEAVANAVRHAEARHVTVTLTADAERLSLEVRDDGRGFEVAVSEVHAFGLISMEERAQALAGRFEVQSGAGLGTTVTLECPTTEPALAAS